MHVWFRVGGGGARPCLVGICDFGVRTWTIVTPPFPAVYVRRKKEQRDVTGDISQQLSECFRAITVAVAWGVVPSNWSLTVLLRYRAPERGPRLVPSAKLSCTAVYSLHHSLVSI